MTDTIKYIYPSSRSPETVLGSKTSEFRMNEREHFNQSKADSLPMIGPLSLIFRWSLYVI